MELSVLLDWLEFTVLNTKLDQVLNLIGIDFDEVSPLEKGRYGYHHQLKWKDGNVFIMFTSINDKVDTEAVINPNSGVHVMITGQGCRQYSVNHSLLKLISSLSAMDKVNFSRIDLAIDDFKSKIISYDKISEAAKNGHFTSRWSKWDEIISRQTSTNEYLGRTMYFGSQNSDLFCRIYDKTLERKVKSEETNIPDKWTRLELVYRKDRAKKLVKYLIDNHIPLGNVLRGTLKQYLRFLIPTTDSNKARWPSVEWWNTLLGDVSKLSLTIEKEARTIEDMTSWVEQQISPTIAAILKAQEGDLAWLRSIIASGSKRLSQKHLDAISQHLEKGVA